MNDHCTFTQRKLTQHMMRIYVSPCLWHLNSQNLRHRINPDVNQLITTKRKDRIFAQTNKQTKKDDTAIKLKSCLSQQNEYNWKSLHLLK